MGNRAVITTPEKEVGLYLHWNGGPASVCAFLTYAKAYGVRDPHGDRAYFFARLCQITGNFLGGTLSCGIDVYEHCDTDNGDNGTYIVGAGLDVIKRLYDIGASESRKESYMRDFLKEINKRMGVNALPDEDLHILDEVSFVSVPGFKITGD